MIDGVKIDVPNLNGSEWLDCHLLDFYTYTNTKTGELLDGTLIAKYKGLKFFITKSSIHPNKAHCSVRGSLHKYFNKGKHNANDFTLFDLQNVIKELEQNFCINPTTAVLRNLEFGVNINTPVSANELLKNLVCYGSYQFVTLKIESVTLGKVIKKQQANLKVYNKGLQYDLHTNNLLRFELAVNKMAYLNKYNIKNLSDLTSIDKIKPLGGLLLSYWGDVVYYDKNINWKQLTPFERKKLLYYATPRNWEDFTRVQRYRAKKHFKELMYRYSTSSTYKDMSQLISNKIQKLTASLCIRFNHDLTTKGVSQNVYDLTVNIHGQNVYNFKSKRSKTNNVENTPKKKRVCSVCKTNISFKRKDAKYCSKRCNNKVNGLRRTKRNQKQRSKEINSLNKLIKLLPKNRIELVITYKTKTGVYSDNLLQYEIQTTSKWISRIKSVVVTGHRKNSKPIHLNNHIAKKLIKEIQKYGETKK